MPVKDMGNGVLLVGHQRNLRRHPGKLDMAAVILTGPDTIKQLIVFPAQRLPPVHIPEDPFLKFLPDHLLFLLCQHGFFLIEDSLFRAVLLHCIINLCVPQV